MLKTYLLYTVLTVAGLAVGVEAVNYAVDGHRHTFIKAPKAKSSAMPGITHSWITDNRAR